MLRAPQKKTIELCLTREARYDFDVSREIGSDNDHNAPKARYECAPRYCKTRKLFCSVSPAAAQCTFSIRNNIFPIPLVVLLFREADFTINNTMWAALLNLLRMSRAPKPDCWRLGRFLECFQLLCKQCLACQVSQARHRKFGSPAKSSGPFMIPKIRSKAVPFKNGPPQYRLSVSVKFSKSSL